MTQLHKDGTAHERIEKDKAMFGGRELTGKTLGVVGLGAIGAAVASMASSRDRVAATPSTRRHQRRTHTGQRSTTT